MIPKKNRPGAGTNLPLARLCGYGFSQNPTRTPMPRPDPADPDPRFYGADEKVFEVTLHEPGRGALLRIPEALIHDLWAARRFDTTTLATTEGAPVVVLDPGTRNTDRGADFSGARLRIGETEWAGDVEIHPTSGGWFDHRHHEDPVYDRVVLHVALYADVWTGALHRTDGTAIPEVLLYPLLDAPLRQLLYQFYTRPTGTLLCADGWPRVPASLRDLWIRTLALERLRARRARLAEAFLQTPDLESLLHERLFAALGYAKNDAPMTTLAQRLPLDLVRQFDDVRDLEALHLGVAGLLPTPADLLDSDRATADYVMALRDRFERLQLHLEIPVMERTAWRFFRLRPANFPPLRIAQAVALLRAGGLLHRDPLGILLQAMRTEDREEALRASLRAVPGPFWETHVRLEKSTKPRRPTLGRARRDALLANAVVPVLLLHAEQTGDSALETALFDVLRALPAAHDEVTRRFEALGTRPRDAFTAQGLQQLYRTRCAEARCLSCRIGQQLLGGSQ